MTVFSLLIISPLCIALYLDYQRYGAQRFFHRTYTATPVPSGKEDTRYLTGSTTSLFAISFLTVQKVRCFFSRDRNTTRYLRIIFLLKITDFATKVNLNTLKMDNLRSISHIVLLCLYINTWNYSVCMRILRLYVVMWRIAVVSFSLRCGCRKQVLHTLLLHSRSCSIKFSSTLWNFTLLDSCRRVSNICSFSSRLFNRALSFLRSPVLTNYFSHLSCSFLLRFFSRFCLFLRLFHSQAMRSPILRYFLIRHSSRTHFHFTTYRSKR